jgi:hypothetical protein
MKTELKEVSWVVQYNPTSPSAYSKVHLRKEDSKVCFCGQFIPHDAEIKPARRSPKEMYKLEKKWRADKGTDQEGVYCLFCLRKALNGGE